ncbi:MAG: hypothetical protein KFF46_00995 [Desulfobacterales bacterium]|nr:hypothetical protein [Desulfobacterales bacterium]
MKKILFLCDASDIDVVEQSFARQDKYDLTIETSEKILQFGVQPYLEQTIERIRNNPDRAVYHPETNSFFYHAFPHSFAPHLRDKIETALKKLIPALGIDNSFFNVELRADEEKQKFAIIEVNCRIAFQFAKTIESVTGTDPLHMLCDVAAGQRPEPIKTRRMTHGACYNFELHLFHDARILETPTQSAFEEIRLKYPEVHIRNLIHENAYLSDFKHNPESYRYAVIDVPGDSHEQIMEKYHHVVSMLGYRFSKALENGEVSGIVHETPPRRI